MKITIDDNGIEFSNGSVSDFMSTLIRAILCLANNVYMNCGEDAAKLWVLSAIITLKQILDNDFDKVKELESEGIAVVNKSIIDAMKSKMESGEGSEK